MEACLFTRSLASLGLIALAGGCVPDFETDLSALRAPRLLAIASNPAETQGNKPATLTALVAVPEGETAPEVAWTLCRSRKPLTELGPVNPVCLEADDGSGAVTSLGRGESVDTVLDQDVCKLFGPLRPSAKAGEPAGRPVDPDVTGGFYQPVVATLDGLPSLGSIRIDCDPANLNRDDALRFRAQYRVNENPRLSALSISILGAAAITLADDDASTPTEVKAGSVVSFRAGWDECPSEPSVDGCSGSERYVWYNREQYLVEPRREGISVAWYASKGSFEVEQTGLDEQQAASRHATTNSWRPGTLAGSATVWVVVRDTRGGVGWRVQHFTVTQ